MTRENQMLLKITSTYISVITAQLLFKHLWPLFGVRKWCKIRMHEWYPRPLQQAKGQCQPVQNNQWPLNHDLECIRYSMSALTKSVLSRMWLLLRIANIQQVNNQWPRNHDLECLRWSISALTKSVLSRMRLLWCITKYLTQRKMWCIHQPFHFPMSVKGGFEARCLIIVEPGFSQWENMLHASSVNGQEFARP